jgi:hypothetical protein
LLLPYLGAQVLYSAINFMQVLPRTHDNDTFLRWPIETFVCPSNTGVLPGGCSYPANRGRGVLKYGYDGLFPRTNGPAVTPAGVSDGSSFTAAFAEWIAGPIVAPENWTTE